MPAIVTILVLACLVVIGVIFRNRLLAFAAQHADAFGAIGTAVIAAFTVVLALATILL